MKSYSLEKIITLDDDDIIYVKKDAIYTQILYYEKHYTQYIEQINYLTEFVSEFMNNAYGCSRIEMSVRDVRKNFTSLQNLPVDSFVKYFF